MPKTPRMSIRQQRRDEIEFLRQQRHDEFLIRQSIRDCRKSELDANIALNVAKRDQTQNGWKRIADLKFNTRCGLWTQSDRVLHIQHNMIKAEEEQQNVDQTERKYILAKNKLNQALQHKWTYYNGQHVALTQQQQPVPQQVVALDFYGVNDGGQNPFPVIVIEDDDNFTLPNDVPDVTLPNVVADVTLPNVVADDTLPNVVADVSHTAKRCA